jgi:hypothetical protein
MISTLMLTISLLAALLGQILRGYVADPHGHAITRASVVLTCGQITAITETDPLGQFILDAPPNVERCVLRISHPGFESLSQRVGVSSKPLLIQLRLSGINEVLNVSSEDKARVLSNETRLASVSLSDIELKTISNNTRELIRYAKALAGTTLQRDTIYVNGLPTSVLPPAEIIERLSINADPFSAEYSESDTNRIEITTKSAERRWRLNLGGASLGVGGGSILDSGLRSDSRSTNLSLSGPIPKLPITFSLSAGLGDDRKDQLITAVVPKLQTSGLAAGSSSAPAANRYQSVSLDSHYSKSDAVRLNFSLYQSSSRSSNANVGGIVEPEAGMGATLASRETRITYEAQGAHRIFRGGAVLTQSESRISANSNQLGINVLGAFTAGGAPTSYESARRVSLTLKTVADLDFHKRLWSAGVTISRAADSEIEVPNPSGVMVFSSVQAYEQAVAGAASGTWFVSRGDGRVRYASTDAAVFAQGDLLRSRKAIVRGGLRADYETKQGFFFSPRIFAAKQVRGFVLRGGGGLFIHNLPNQMFLQLIRNDGSHLQNLVVKNMHLRGMDGGIPTSLTPLVSTRAPNFTRQGDLVFKGSIERQYRSLVSGLEYNWSRGFHLAGSRRLQTSSGWIDFLESNRRAQRHALHARLSYEWKGQSIVGHYEFIHARDDTDGAFSFPQDQNNVVSEWARSTGLSPQNLEVVGSFRLPAGVSVSAVLSSKSSAPYNIASGADASGFGLYNDRGGRPRNSGNGPPYNSVALFGYRKFPVPRFVLRSKDRVFIDVGVQVENLFDRANYSGYGAFAGSPLFGKPTGAFQGRSLRIWFNFD